MFRRHFPTLADHATTCAYASWGERVEWPLRGPLPMVRHAQPRRPDHWLSRAWRPAAERALGRGDGIGHSPKPGVGLILEREQRPLHVMCSALRHRAKVHTRTLAGRHA